MVFESIVVDLLNRFLGDYVENLDSGQLKLGIWGGDAVLTNLILKQSALDEFDLPVKTIYGQLGKLVLKIPWKNLYGAPVIAEVEKLFLLAVPNNEVYYNPEKEEKLARENKLAELQRIDNAKLQEMKKDQPKPDDTFVEKLATQIIKNVQIKLKNIHIRYEDSTTKVPYSMGFTLNEVEVVSTDENWKAAISTEVSSQIYKILSLDSLAVYWNDKSELFSKLNSHKEITEHLQADIATKVNKPTNYSYLFGPINADARLKLLPKPENTKPAFSIPKVLLNLELDKLAIALNKPQYQDIINFVDSMDYMKRGVPFRKFRPKVNTYTGHYKEWWLFAYNCVLESEVKRRRRNWDITHIMQHRQLCRNYAQCYKQKLTNKKIPQDVEHVINECEDKLDVFNLVLLRQRVEMEIMKLDDQIKEQQSKQTWWSSWFGTKTNEDVSDLQESTAILRKFENAMTPEEKAKLYHAIDYTDNVEKLEYPENYVEIKVAFVLQGLVIKVHDEHGRRILSAELNDVKCRAERRPHADAIKINVKINLLKVCGVEQGNKIPEIVSVIKRTEDSLLDAMFETNPLDKKCHQRIFLTSRPLRIIYDAQTVIELVKIFAPPKDSSALDQLAVITNMKMTALKEKSLLGMEYAIENRFKMEIDIRFSSFYIVIPYNGFYTGNESALVADLGEFTVKTLEDTTQTMTIYEQKVLQLTDEDIFEEMMEKSYEKYVIKLKHMQVLIALKDENWETVLDDSSASKLHLFQPISLIMQVERCLILDDPRLPKIKVTGTLPSIKIKVSDKRLLELIALGTSIPLPLLEAPDSEILALKEAPSFASSISTLHMAQQFIIDTIKEEQQIVNMKQKDTSDLIQLTDLIVKFDMNEFVCEVAKEVEVENVMTPDLNQTENVLPTIQHIICRLALSELEFEMATQTFNQDITARLANVSIEQFKPEGEKVSILKTSRDQEATEDYLFSFTFSKVDKNSPEFQTRYEACEQLLFVEFKKLEVLLHQECLKDLLEFTTNLQNKMNEILYVPPSNETITDTVKLHQIKRSRLETIPESASGLNVPIVSVKKKKKNSINKSDSTLLKIEMHIHGVTVKIANIERELSSLSVQGLYMDVIFKKSSIQIISMLRDISVLDPNPKSIYKKILTVTGDETLRVSVIIYTKDQLSETDTDLDMSVNVRVNAVQIVFLNWFVSSQLQFLNNFQAAQQAIVEASAAAAEHAKQNVQSAYSEAMRMKLKIHVKAPDILIPMDSQSVNCIRVDLGRLNLSNAIMNLNETTDNTNVQPIVEEIRILLNDMKVSRVQVDQDNLTILDNTENVMLEPITFQLDIQRNLTVHATNLPDIDINGRLKLIKLQLNHEDYAMIMMTLQRNFAEGNKPPDSQKSVQVKTTMVADRRESKSVKSTIEMTRATMQPTATLTPFEENPSNVFLKFSFTLDSLIIDLLKTNNRDGQGLGRFTMDVLSVKGRILSDSTLITSVVLVDCILDDTRDLDDSSRITRFLKRRQAEDYTAAHTSDQMPKSMLDITYQQQNNDMFVDIRVFSFDCIFATDYIMTLLDFTNLELEPTKTDSPIDSKSMVKSSTGIAKNKSTVATNASITQVPEGTMTINIRVEQPDIVLMESTSKKNTEALVLNCELVMKARFSGNHQVISGSIKDLQLFSCEYILKSSQKKPIIRPISISLAGSTPSGDEEQGLHIDVIFTDVRISVSPATIELANRIVNKMTTRNEQISENETRTFDNLSLWNMCSFAENDFWFLKPDTAEEVDEDWIIEQATNKIINKKNEMCILNIPSIVFTLEAGIGNQTLPMILLETKLTGIVGNWSTQMYVDATLSLQMAYYNSRLALWEPLIEPNEYFTNDQSVRQPWELKFEMEMKNLEDKDSTPMSDNEDSFNSPGGNTEQCILIKSKENLEITVTKTCLDVINNLSKAFQKAIEPPSEQSIMEEQITISPYRIINDTGIDVVLMLYSSAFMVMNNAQCNEVQIGAGGQVPLQLKVADDAQATTIDFLKKEFTGSAIIDMSKTVHLKVQGFRTTIELPIVRTDKRYYPLISDKDPNCKWGLISDIQEINGCTTVYLRSIVQIHNHFDQAIDVYYMTDAKTVELIGSVEPQNFVNLPLKAVYAPINGVFFGLPNYSITTQPFIWKDLQLNLAMVHLLECRPKDKQRTKNGFFIRVMGEIEQVYNENTFKHTMISVGYHLHLRSPVHFRNCLPYPIVICISGSVDEVILESGHRKLLPTVEPNVTNIVVRIDDYLDKSWSCKHQIESKPAEFSVWAFDSFDSIHKVTLDLGCRTTTINGEITLSLYCPFWMINKTGRMLTYRTNAEDALNVLYHPENLKGPILFSFNSKNFFGKKKASIRLEDGDWSNKFPIDVAGSSGVVQCKTNDIVYQIGVRNQLTYNGLTKQIVFTPLFILINDAPFAIEVQEVDRPGDSWIVVEPNSCTPLWPKSNREDKLLRLRIANTTEISAPFLITDVYATLLKLANNYGGVNVDLQIQEGATYITFSCYEHGSAPGLIINHTSHPIKFWEKESINVRTLNPSNYIYYTWENPAGKRMLVWDSEKKLEIENDLRKDGIGDFYITDETSSEIGRKVKIFWVSFLDGLQRILLFTDQEDIAQNAQTAGELEAIQQEINISIHGIGLSLVNNIIRKEIMYIGIASSGIIWEVAKNTSDRFKPLTIQECAMIEQAYQHYQKQLAIQSNTVESHVIIDSKLEVDFLTEQMLKPNKRRLRRIFQTGLWMQMKTSPHQLQLHAKINRIQIDNQLYDCIFPVVLAPVPPPKSVAADTALKPFVELSIVQRVMKHSTVQQFKYFSLLIQEFHIKVDLGFINAILECVQSNDPTEEEILEYFQKDLQLVDEQLHCHVSQQTLQDRKNFYDLLHFSPLKIHVSFSLQGGSSAGGESSTSEYLGVLLQGIGVTLTDMHDVVFRLAYFQRDYVFLTQKQLINEATLHYVGQLVKQLYVLVLGLDVIGNPYGLVLGITKGVEDLFYEPFQGAIQGPGEFAEGLVLGVRSLFGHTVGGAAGAVSRITGAMGKGIAALSFDEDYQKKRRELLNKRPHNIQEGIARGGKGIVMGLFDGVTGVFVKPISGAKEQGVEGFFKGLGKGAIGLVARPTAGVVDFASGSLDAVKRYAEGEEIVRLRPPRFIPSDSVIMPYCLVEAEGHRLLMELDKGKYANTDIYVHHSWVIQKKEILLLTNKRIAYVIHNDIFGGWQVDWSYTWQDMSSQPKANERGIYICLPEPKKKVLGMFGSNESGKLITLPESKNRQKLLSRMTYLFEIAHGTLMSPGTSSPAK